MVLQDHKGAKEKEISSARKDPPYQCGTGLGRPRGKDAQKKWKFRRHRQQRHPSRVGKHEKENLHLRPSVSSERKRGSGDNGRGLMTVQDRNLLEVVR